MEYSIINNIFNGNVNNLCGVYKLYSTSKPTIIYIGSTSRYLGRKGMIGFNSRLHQHVWLLKNKKHHSKYLQNIINKYGLASLIMEILAICNPDDCIKQEQYFIDHLEPILNTVKKAGSTIGYKHTQESIQKMSNQRKGRKKPPQSEETRRKMSDIMKTRNLDYLRLPSILKKRSDKMKGRKSPESTYNKIRKPIYQLTRDSVIIGYFNSPSEASSKLKIDKASIINCALKNRPSAGGFLWIYQKEAKQLGLSFSRLSK